MKYKYTYLHADMIKCNTRRAGGETEREQEGKGNFISMEGKCVVILCSPSVPFFMSLKLCPKTVLKILPCQLNGFRYSPEYCNRFDYLVRIAGMYSLILRHLQ